MTRNFSAYLSRIPGLRFIAGELNLLSGVGRRMLENSRWLISKREIEDQFRVLDQMRASLENVESSNSYQQIRLALMHIRDIRFTLQRLKSGEILNDVELFEIKGLAQASMRIRENLPGLKTDMPDFPDLTDVLSLLDPEKTGASSFHIYDCYSEDLARLRSAYEHAKKNGNSAEADRLMTLSLAEESKIRKDLSLKLLTDSDNLTESLEHAGELDLLVAKADLIIRWNLIIPEISESETRLRGMWNPEVKNAVEGAGGEYQEIDITFGRGVTLITGANMAGKSVVLKSLGLIQVLFQFGFGIPARNGGICPVADVMTSIGDGQSELEGLSSFAAEMQRIDAILAEARSRTILALIDEPARTTNPEEGAAIAEALAEILSEYNSETLITTHYSVESKHSRRLRVRGLDQYNDTLPLTPESIGNLIDYTLTEDNAANPPREALRIAAMLGLDKELIRLSAEKIKPKYAKE